MDDLPAGFFVQDACWRRADLHSSQFPGSVIPQLVARNGLIFASSIVQDGLWIRILDADSLQVHLLLEKNPRSNF